jgi:arachidonate 15-lipoxygenase
MNPILPQNDPTPSRRTEALARARELYRYSFTHLPGFPLAAELPAQDAPSPEWLEQVGEAMVTILVNSARIDGDVARSSRQHSDNQKARASVLRAPHQALKTVLDAIMQRIQDPAPAVRATYIGQFARLFHEIQLPWTVAYLINDDANFAHSLLTGPNPLLLQRVTQAEALNERFPVEDLLHAVGGEGSFLNPDSTPKSGSAAREGSALRADAEAGRLYLADFSMLEGLPCGQAAGFQKYLSAPLALFKVYTTEEGGNELRPVAIQLGPRPGQNTPVFSPRDHWAWVVAKTHVRAASGNVHQVVAHLAHTHLVMEPVALAMFRQLAPSHPVHILLRPHFEGLLEINQQAWEHLLAPGGGVDTIMAAKIEAAVQLATQAALSWSFNDAMFPRSLALRGLGDSDLLPAYWYRADGRLLWSAIREWVSGYLRLYYQGSTDVQVDRELQAWVAEMLSPEGGRMRDIGEEGAFKTLEYLIDAVAHIIFTSSVQHAAVNFPQYELMSYVPKLPLAVYTPPPTNKNVGHPQFLSTLPPMKIAYGQLQLGYLLSSVRCNRLGHYALGNAIQELAADVEQRNLHNLLGDVKDRWAGYFRDPRVQGPLQAFQQALTRIEKTIDERNAECVYPYHYLKPSLIPQSINI